MRLYKITQADGTRIRHGNHKTRFEDVTTPDGQPLRFRSADEARAYMAEHYPDRSMWMIEPLPETAADSFALFAR